MLGCLSYGTTQVPPGIAFFAKVKGENFNFRKKLRGKYQMFHRFKFVFGSLLFLSLFCLLHNGGLYAAEKNVIKLGDKVGIQFTCQFPNGEIAASTSTAVAIDPSLRKSPVYLPAFGDDPIEVTAGEIGPAKSFPIPFEDEILIRIAPSLVGMTPGETRTIEIHSERPPNVPLDEQFVQLSLVRQRPKEIRMTKAEYKSRTGKDPEVGAEFVLDPAIPGKVASVSESEVLIRFSAQPGSKVETPFGKGTIRENGDKYEIVIDAVEGRLVRTKVFVGCISNVLNRTFTLDYGNPFGGEHLTCDVKAERIADGNLSKKEK